MEKAVSDLYQPWETISEEMVLDAPPYLNVKLQHVRTNTCVEIEDFWQIQLPDFCIAVAFSADENVITLREYKHGARRWGLCFPAGHIELGESPEAAMKRELREETGYEASNIISLGNYVANSNQGCGRGYLFLMLGCRKIFDPSLDPAEKIELKLMKKDEVENHLYKCEAVSLPQLAVWAAASISLKQSNTYF